MKKVSLIVFDLDYTLWPFWVDTHVSPPFKKGSDGQVKDAEGQLITYYEEVPSILEGLTKDGYKLGIASRTAYPRGAEKLLQLFDWNKYFTYKVIFPGNKTVHFTRIQKESGIPFSEMVFFDDEYRNISAVKTLGVTCIYVKNGVTKELIDKTLKHVPET